MEYKPSVNLRIESIADSRLMDLMANLSNMPSFSFHIAVEDIQITDNSRLEQILREWPDDTRKLLEKVRRQYNK